MKFLNSLDIGGRGGTVDAQRSGRCNRKVVEVQILSPAL